jgi:molybdate transport system regulatory protein
VRIITGAVPHAVCTKYGLIKEKQMQISARNQIIGTIKQIKQDAIMAELTIQIEGGAELVSVITASSVQHLGLAEGKQVAVVIKSTDVMLGGLQD